MHRPIDMRGYALTCTRACKVHLLQADDTSILYGKKKFAGLFVVVYVSTQACIYLYIYISI